MDGRPVERPEFQPVLLVAAELVAADEHVVAVVGQGDRGKDARRGAAADHLAGREVHKHDPAHPAVALARPVGRVTDDGSLGRSIDRKPADLLKEIALGRQADDLRLEVAGARRAGLRQRPVFRQLPGAGRRVKVNDLSRRPIDGRDRRLGTGVGGGFLLERVIGHLLLERIVGLGLLVGDIFLIGRAEPGELNFDLGAVILFEGDFTVGDADELRLDVELAGGVGPGAGVRGQRAGLRQRPESNRENRKCSKAAEGVDHGSGFWISGLEDDPFLAA